MVAGHSDIEDKPAYIQSLCLPCVQQEKIRIPKEKGMKKKKKALNEAHNFSYESENILKAL